jgi:hypothetical protein
MRIFTVVSLAGKHEHFIRADPLITPSTLQQRYILLAHAVKERWPDAFSSCCADCPEICCRPHMAEDILSSPWLAAIGQLEQGNWVSRPGNFHPNCLALGPTGCIFIGAKPPFCSTFYCDALLNSIPDPAELVAGLFLGAIPKDTCRLSGRLNLLELEPATLEQSIPLVEQALTRGESNLALYKHFQSQVDEGLRYRDVLQMLARIPSLLTAAVSRRLQN